jgi:hypothetical protein
VAREKGIEISIDILIERTKDFFEALLKFLRHQRKKRATRIAVYEDGCESEVVDMGKPLSNTDVRRLVLVPKNEKDKVDSIQKGTMKAVSTDDAIAAVALDPQDELQALITPADGAQGLVTFTFTADADMGEGVQEISGEYSCEVVDQMATIIQVEEGEDLPKEPTPTPVKGKP